MRQALVKTADFRAAMRGGEWIWGGIGIGAASLSACFAAYMLAFGPSETTGRNLGDFGLFARMQPIQRAPDGRVIPFPAGVGQPTPASDRRGAPAAASGPVDFNPTGSLGATAGVASRTAIPMGSSVAGSDQVLASFILRDVFDGQALVETPNAVTLVSKGSIIAGAGVVLSIERRGRQWAVITSGGVIGGAR